MNRRSDIEERNRHAAGSEHDGDSRDRSRRPDGTSDLWRSVRGSRLAAYPPKCQDIRPVRQGHPWHPGTDGRYGRVLRLIEDDPTSDLLPGSGS